MKRGALQLSTLQTICPPFLIYIMYIRQTPAADPEAAAVPVAAADSVPAADSLPRMKKRRAPAFDVSNAFDTKKRRFYQLSLNIC